MEGHYDLIGPDGEIILPSMWERVFQPDWAVTMIMWPLEEQSRGEQMKSVESTTCANVSNGEASLEVFYT